MSDTNTSSEVSNNLYNNYKYTDGESIQVVVSPMSVDLRNIDLVNPDGTSGAIIMDEPNAKSISSKDLLVGMVAMPVAPISPELEAVINERAEKSGGVRKSSNPVKELQEREAKAKKTEGRVQE